MNVLHLLASGGVGGIEVLCKEYAQYSQHKNVFVFLLGKTRTICKEMKKNGDIVYEINNSKLDIPGTFKALSGLCEAHKIDVIVEHHSSPILYMYIWALKLKYKSLRSVMYAHSNAALILRLEEKGLFFRKIVLSKGLYQADRIVAISNSVKESLVHYFKIKEDKIRVIYNGVNTEKFSSDIQKRKSYSKIIYVGRLIEKKGVQLTLDELSNLSPETKFYFMIVGDGDYREELEKYVKRKHLEGKVSFWGTRNDVAELLKESDIFIHMPLLEEGFGITIIEAMAAGLICICNDRGAIPEIIDNGVNGFILDHNKTGVLSELLNRIFYAENHNKLNEIGMNAVNSAKKYSIENFSQSLDKLIENSVFEL